MAQASVQNVLYIDDQLMFVEVAKGLGIKGIHHTDYESTTAKLNTFGLTQLNENRDEAP